MFYYKNKTAIKVHETPITKITRSVCDLIIRFYSICRNITIKRLSNGVIIHDLKLLLQNNCTSNSYKTK